MKGLPRWFWWVSLSVLFATSLPYLFGLAIRPEGTLYLGVHSNYDDHAVYAAWVKQAQEGHFFFENRFTTEQQLGKTIHLYFLAAGWTARLAGIPIALHLFRVLFGFLALLAIYRFIASGISEEAARLPAFILSVVTAGVGFLFWNNYGFNGPIDVWQPEAFVTPSLMQNGLFCASIWLILLVWKSILKARESWEPVAVGAAAILVLTNIHTYDTLNIGIVAIGLLAAMLATKSISAAWLARSLIIACGAIPAILWFLYIRGNDPVFAARAATVTISAPAYWVLAGAMPALLLSGYGFAKKGSSIAVIAGGLFMIAVAVIQAISGYQMDQLWLSTPAWLLLAAIAICICSQYKPTSPYFGLLFAWILMGFVALYYPGLFQRKLAMALALPIGIAAGFGLQNLKISDSKLPLSTAVSALVLGASSFLWIFREMAMPTRNLSNTTMQRIYWSPEVAEFLKFFQENTQPSDAVVAMPGVAVPDNFEKPTDYQLAIPDLNAVMSGWGGVKTYAGHWSETPDYLAKRQRVSNDLFSPNTTKESAHLLMTEAQANYIIAPKSEIARQAGVPPPEFYASLGEIIYEGNEWLLVRFRPSP